MTAETELLTVEQMYQVDRLAIEGGISGVSLMEAAGQGVADQIMQRWPTGRCLVLCGPGNNGGDGYVVARLLRKAGWQVDLVSTVDPEELTGDAAIMQGRWDGAILPISEAPVGTADIAVDAIFGAGFSRYLDSGISALLLHVRDTGVPVVAVDVPSGMNGDTGIIDANAIPACLTVTFFRAKPGHFLYPGRGLCGELAVIDIGIEAQYLRAIKPAVRRNEVTLWCDDLPLLQPEDHKYSRGHAAINGGGISATGAARLAARAALRAGAGAVTVISPPSALMVYAGALEAVMVTSCGGVEDFDNWITARRIGAILIGPGNGVTERTKAFTQAALASPATVVLDADAITVFKEDPDALFSFIKSKRQGRCILTPHEAEFERVFGVTGSKLDRALAAAAQSGAIMVLKGADTVIASPAGQAVINHNAPPWLATAGSGDVLAGIITGLISGGMPAFSAAAAGCWIHGVAAGKLGTGMISEDIEREIPVVFAGLEKKIATA